MPSLSVIVPFYKDYAYVEQAVHSVLIQGLPEVEIVLVNDNPCAETETFLKSLNFPETVRIINHETNRGLSAARNTGVKAAHGEYIAYLDADDYYLPGGLAHQLDVAQRTGADITHATTMLRERDRQGYPYQALVGRDTQFFRRDLDDTDLRQTPELQFIVSSWKSIYKKQHLARHKITFDEEQRKFEDRLYVLENVFAQGRVSLVAKPVRIWRRREGSITTSPKTDVDLLMMANLIGKCTDLVAVRVEQNQCDSVFLRREIYHSISRLVWDTGLLDAATSDIPVALQLRDILTAALRHQRLDPAIFNDPVVQIIDRTGMTNRRGAKVDAQELITLQHAIADGDWVAARTMWIAAGGLQPDPAEQTPAAPVFISSSDANIKNVELTLHIGLHKTGTTHLQHRFRQSHEALIEQGWLFPKTGFIDHSGSSAKSEATPGHQGFVHAAVLGDKTLREKLIAEIAASGCNKVLISCENMSFPQMEARWRNQRIAALDGFFSGFGQRRVAVVLRRPDTYFEALYRERVANPHLRESRAILNFLDAQGDTMLDYESMLAPWKNIAGEHLLLSSYEDLAATQDYFTAFCQGLGISLIPMPEGVTHTYTSPARETIEMMRMINALAPIGDQKLNLSRSFMNGTRKLDKTGDQSALHIEARQQIVARVRDNSAAFLTQCGLDLPFDTMIEDIEAERAEWRPISAIDHDLVQLVMHAAQLQDSKDLWAGASQGKTNLLIHTKRTLSRWLRDDRQRARLMKIYRALPAPAKRWARAFYERMAQ